LNNSVVERIICRWITQSFSRSLRLCDMKASIVIAAVIVTHIKTRAATELDWWKQEKNLKSVSKLAQSMALTGASEDIHRKNVW
jgi:hypothetical protein